MSYTIDDLSTKKTTFSITSALYCCWYVCAGSGWNSSSSPQPVSVLELSEGDRIALTSSLLQ